MTKKLTKCDYHLRMVRYMKSEIVGVGYFPAMLREHGGIEPPLKVLILGDPPWASSIVLDPRLVLRRFSDERMAEEILFKTPLAKLYERLKREEVKI